MSLTLQLDSIFAGRYRVVRAIASGGMGAVYEVVHLETERRRALKVLQPKALRNAEARERFKREAKVGALIDSEFVVDVFDAGIDAATQMPFMVMELLKGEELGARIERAGPLSPVEVVTYLHQAALALDKSHRASVIHRDIKPENLFLTVREDGPPVVKVLDFGIAKLLADGGLTANATKSVGTPLYMAPEQYQGNHVISSATDVYALAHVAYTLLVGGAYFEDEALGDSGIIGFALAVSRGPQESPLSRARRRSVNLPPAFDGWFYRATSLHPQQRFSRATECIGVLADALGVLRPGTSTFSPEAATAREPATTPWRDSVPTTAAPTVRAAHVTNRQDDGPPTQLARTSQSPSLTSLTSPGRTGMGASVTQEPRSKASPVAVASLVLLATLCLGGGGWLLVMRMHLGSGEPSHASAQPGSASSAIALGPAAEPPAVTVSPQAVPVGDASATPSAPAASSSVAAPPAPASSNPSGQRPPSAGSPRPGRSPAAVPPAPAPPAAAGPSPNGPKQGPYSRD